VYVFFSSILVEAYEYFSLYLLNQSWAFKVLHSYIIFAIQDFD